MSAIDSTRLKFASRVYEYVQQNVEDFEKDEIGTDLAHVLGAIVTSGCYVLPESQPLIKLLQQEFDLESLLWKFIEFEKEDEK